jgi:HAD superfamily hydrolase (TIGR01484 family)
MAKQVIAFDLDGTLAESKSPLPDKMAELITELLDRYQVCVISGGKFGQFEKQLLANLHAAPLQLERLHLMPTCGTRYHTYDLGRDTWDLNYAEDFTADEKKKIVAALEEGIDELGLREKAPWGELIEDRGSQITFSALGQEAPVHAKEAWDPDGKKKHALRNLVAEKIPDFEVRAGGSTSIDITKLGIDKAYGMQKLMALTDINKEEILFVGDRLEEGGNDYPVKAMGIDTIAVTKWEDTALVIETLVKVS